MTSFDRTDRLLLERQVRDLDSMILQMTNMRSVLDRRMRRMYNQRTSPQSPPRANRGAQTAPNAPRAPRVPRQLDNSQVTSDDMDEVAIVLEDIMNQDDIPEPSAVVEEEDRLHNHVAHLSDEDLHMEHRIHHVVQNHQAQNPSEADYTEEYVRRVYQLCLNGHVNINEISGTLQQLIYTILEDEHENEQPAPAPAPVRPTRLPKQKVSVLKKTEVSVPMESPCPICYESYTQIQSCQFNCQHTTCVGCMQKWTASQSTQGQCISCPMCRENIKMVVTYRERKSRNGMDVVV